MGLVDKVKGAIVQPDPGEADAQHQERQETVRKMWEWLIRHFDAGVLMYLHEGRDDGLREVLAADAFEDTKRYLDKLRAEGVAWEFPDRERLDARDVRLEQVVGNTFVVSVYYRDYSILRWYANSQLMEERRANGEERALRATITVDAGSGADVYYITKLVDTGSEA